MFKVARTDLSKALAKFRGVVPKRHKTPALQCVALQVESGTLKISGTANFDFWLSVDVKIETSTDDELLVNYHSLASAVSACADDSIEFSRSENNRISIKSGTFSLLLETNTKASPSDLAAPDFKRSSICTVGVSGLARALRFSSKDATRYYLSGVHLGYQSGHITTTTTDGHRLFRTLTPSNRKTSVDVLISAPATRKIVAIAGGSDRVQIELSQAYCRVKKDGVTLVGKLIDGKFPDVDRVIPSGDVDGSIKVDFATLASAADRVSIVDHGRPGRGVRVVGNGSTAAISYDGLDFGASDVIQAETSGKPIETRFNADYLNDFAKVAHGDVEIEMRGGAGSPFIFNAADSDDILLIMPMRP